MHIFKHWWIFTFRVRQDIDVWDGGGMLCTAPHGILLGLDVGNVGIELRWKYTRGQILRLSRKQPDLWDNCPLPRGGA